MTATARPRLIVSKAGEARIEPGRRASLANRDLGAIEATAGKMAAVLVTATQGMGPASGWHYHVCDYQLIYILDGWVDFEAEDGTRTRLDAGDSAVIPGGMRHNVPGTSDVLEVLTVTVPPEEKTVACERPTGL